jgi:hypothetical protein
MRTFIWDTDKNNKLKSDPNRSICFEDIVEVIKVDGYLADIAHPNRNKYPHQRMFVVAVKDYVYGVPYVEADNVVFLKTAFQSRRLKKTYLIGVSDGK